MFDGQPKTVIIYEDADGYSPYEHWFDDLPDRRAQARIDARVARLAAGNPGDYKSLGAGLHELRIDYGPGYRLYLAFADQQIILLLCAGDKKTQQADISQARAYWKDQQQRKPQ